MSLTLPTDDAGASSHFPSEGTQGILGNDSVDADKYLQTLMFSYFEEAGNLKFSEARYFFKDLKLKRYYQKKKSRLTRKG